MKLPCLLAIFACNLCIAQDATVDWLLNQSSTQPTTQPATQPATQSTSPLQGSQEKQGRKGRITLSDGSAHSGVISTTPGKPLRFWDDSIKEYRDVPLEQIASMDAKVLWERDEPEWHFIESGSDTKEFTGKTYPARETEYVVKLANGQRFTGGVVAPLYLEGKGQARQHVLHRRAKGPVGKPLAEFIYVVKVELSD